MKLYPTAVGLGSLSLLNALKKKVEDDRPVTAVVESDALKADIQDAHADQVFKQPLACTPPTRDNHMLGDAEPVVGLFRALISYCFQAHNAFTKTLFVPWNHLH